MADKFKYRTRYVWSKPFGNPYHRYEVIGAKGGLHLHITDMGEGFKYGDRYSAGLECHYRYPPAYMAHKAPSHDECHLLKCPCWHDGTSLYAQEHWVPLFESGLTPEQMLERLCDEADERFEKLDEAA